jgi:protein-S-isoprenylcysteine O-methyltransferase Ste14
METAWAVVGSPRFLSRLRLYARRITSDASLARLTRAAKTLLFEGGLAYPSTRVPSETGTESKVGIYKLIIGALWLVLMAVWLVSAMGAKKSAIRAPRRQAFLLRLAVLACFLALWRWRLLDFLLARPGEHLALFLAPAVRAVGVAVCAIGVGLAIWARMRLGQNWGMPMSLRQGHELVTDGPYAFVRHPIYTGAIFAMLGSALAADPRWLVLLALFGAYFIYSARAEEKLMSQQFPDRYPDYKTRTKMLIPFVL